MYAAVVISVLFPHLIEPSTTAQQAIEETFPPLDMHWMIGVMLFVGVWEEVVFRGFLLTRLQVLLKRRWLTVLIGAAAFGAVHSYEGPLAMSVIFVLGIVLGTLFVWRRSLVPGVVYHAAHNLIVVRLMHEVSPTWQ
jgi:membrane protease YdiL (CAAX protease family)